LNIQAKIFVDRSVWSTGTGTIVLDKIFPKVKLNNLHRSQSDLQRIKLNNSFKMLSILQQGGALLTDSYSPQTAYNLKLITLTLVKTCQLIT
jgi:hypothetical protein